MSGAVILNLPMRPRAQVPALRTDVLASTDEGFSSAQIAMYRAMLDAALNAGDMLGHSIQAEQSHGLLIAGGRLDTARSILMMAMADVMRALDAAPRSPFERINAERRAFLDELRALLC